MAGGRGGYGGSLTNEGGTPGEGGVSSSGGDGTGRSGGGGGDSSFFGGAGGDAGGGYGGAGGIAGVTTSASTGSAYVRGGGGSAGQSTESIGGGGGGGGAGGYGTSFLGGGSFYNQNTTRGGAGGGGGAGGDSGNTANSYGFRGTRVGLTGRGGGGGVGGSGGAGFTSSSQGIALTNLSGIYGGDGGAGGAGGGDKSLGRNYGGVGGDGGAGGSGVILTENSSLRNAGAIVGGSAGAGGAGLQPPGPTIPGLPSFGGTSSGHSGKGGDGVTAAGKTTITNSLVIAGGASDVGVGGTGVSMSLGGSLMNSGSTANVVGGTGGGTGGLFGGGASVVNTNGGAFRGGGGSGQYGAGSIDGGAAVILTDGSLQNTNSASITGGSGVEATKFDPSAFNVAPVGGDGGTGIIFDGSTLLNSGAAITGGGGGNATETDPGRGGAGGSGIVFSGSRLENSNSAAIMGGNGGTAGLFNGIPGGDTSGGGGGGDAVAMLSASSELDNSARIAGGDSGEGLLPHDGGGVGVRLSSRSALVNAGTGIVTGGSGGSGIAGGGAGVIVGVDAAEVSNLDNAQILGGDSNFVGDGGAAIVMQAAGVVTNSEDASLRGGMGGSAATVSYSGGGSTSYDGGDGGSGVEMNAQSGVLTNAGTISGGDGGLGGTSPALAGGAGGAGVSATGGGTIVNTGSILGGAGGAGGPSGMGGAGVTGVNLVLTNAGLISGGLSGDAVQADAIDFTGGTSSLTLGDARTQGSIDGQIGVGGTIVVDPGAGTSRTLSNQIHDYAGTATGALSKVGTGTLTLTGSNTYSGGTIIQMGTLDLDAAATVTNGITTAGAAGTGAITFAGASGSSAILRIEAIAQPASGGTFGNTLDAFGSNDLLDLRGFTFSMSTTVTYDAGGHVLSVSDGTKTESFNLTNETPGANNMFFAQRDADGSGTLITNTVCFASGTLIRTVRGDVAVEDLRVGDLAVTSSGTQRPIRWLGHRAVDCRNHPRPWEVWPVHVAAHAFGENRPTRDLLVSPGHSLCVDVLGEVLIPAMALVNGTTVRQDEVDAVTYWHVEVDGHDVLFAENMPAESYLEMGNRGFFAEAAVVDLDAAPDAPVPTHADFCRPFHADGAIVDFVRERLAARAIEAGWRRVNPPLDEELRLEVDGVQVMPNIRASTARFLVPARAKEVWLVSDKSVPRELGAGPDARALGVCVGSLTVDDGFGAPTVIPADDVRLCVGFHDVEAGPQRWTCGRARLPAALWEGSADAFFLRVDLARPSLPRWKAPAATAATSLRSAAYEPRRS